MESNNNSNKILMGIIMILVALYFISRSYFHFSHGDIPVLIAGFALLLLFHTKRKRWALILGILVTYWGVGNILPAGSILAGVMKSSAVFFVPSLILLAYYFSTRVRGYLVPGLITFWLGMYTALISFWPLSASSGWLLCATLLCLSLYTFDRYYSGRWAIKGAALFFVLFVLSLLGSLVGFSAFGLLFGFAPAIVCGLLILGGLVLIFKGFKK